MDAEVIVVGGGVVGLWTANNLIAQGVKTILFEQFPYPHTRGSSHGQSRIIRTAYDKEEYSALMPESYRKWRELERASEKTLLLNTPLVTLYNADKVDDEYESMKRNMEKYQPNHEAIAIEELTKRYPHVRGNPGSKVIIDEGGGILRADNCLQSLRDWFTARGGVLLDCEGVIGLNPVSDSEIVVTTTKKKYRSQSVVLTCGSYINKILMNVDLQLPVKAAKVIVHYWKEKENSDHSLANKFPAFIFQTGPAHVYSIPAFEYPGLMKICFHLDYIFVDPESRDSDPTEEVKSRSEDMFQLLRQTIINHFPDIDVSSPAISETCMYTVSPDSNFILDHHPKHRNIIFGSGFSGHGFKTSPAVGHILANMAQGLQPPYPLHPFSLNRFGKNPFSKL